MLLLIALAALLVRNTSSASLPPPRPRQSRNGDWAAFGRTVDDDRYSPLTDITPANVGQLGRVYAEDFLAIDPDTRRGQQSSNCPLLTQRIAPIREPKPVSAQHWSIRTAKECSVMSSRSTSRVRFWVAALGLTLVAAVAAPGTVAASGPPVTAPPAATWSHNPASSTGPQFWSSLDPAWAACANTDGQSPVVIVTRTRDRTCRRCGPTMPAPRCWWRTPATSSRCRNRTTTAGPWSSARRPTYHLQQWHIHAPAEHVVNGQRADLEIHLVHSRHARDTPRSSRSSPTSSRGSTGRAARRPRGCSARCCGARPDTAGEETDLHQRTSAAVLLGAGPAVFGDNKVTMTSTSPTPVRSTTPPCTGGVGWYLLPKTSSPSTPPTSTSCTS